MIPQRIKTWRRYRNTPRDWIFKWSQICLHQQTRYQFCLLFISVSENATPKISRKKYPCGWCRMFWKRHRIKRFPNSVFINSHVDTTRERWLPTEHYSTTLLRNTLHMKLLTKVLRKSIKWINKEIRRPISSHMSYWIKLLVVSRFMTSIDKTVFKSKDCKRLSATVWGIIGEVKSRHLYWK